MRTFLATVFAICVVGLVVPGCVTVKIPVEEYNLARAAVNAARDTEAARFAPGLWHKAEESYKRAQHFYKDRRYKEAQELFVEARLNAERAENAARVARFQSGEVTP